jgi:hypothetical protein
MAVCDLLVQAQLIGPLLLAAMQSTNIQLSTNVQCAHSTQLKSVISIRQDMRICV